MSGISTLTLHSAGPVRSGVEAGAFACRRKFLRFFPRGFTDPKYLAWERNYKWQAHRRWQENLHRQEMERLLELRNYAEMARRAIEIESRTNLLFSFEKMALRDAVRSEAGAHRFATGLYEYLFGSGAANAKFEAWCETVAALPRKQTRVLTWPIVTVVGFLAAPLRDIFLQPIVTRRAAGRYGLPFPYQTRPNWNTYSSFLKLARTVRRDLIDLHPKDMIDIQSFLWVQGSEEYA